MARALFLALMVAAIADLAWASSSQADDESDPYCKVSLNQTLCMFSGPSEACGFIRVTGLNETERDLLVSEHNRLRANVANGNETRGAFGLPQPEAADMLQMTWDDELASVAQMWAEQCIFGHDANRNVPRFIVGQNIFISFAPVAQQMQDVITKAVDSWYEEVDDFNSTEIQSYRFHPESGHYTQLVWAESSFLGCGQVTYDQNGLVNQFVVCNYGPAGNVVGQPIYTVGSACSMCPDGTTCSIEFPGLCTFSNTLDNFGDSKSEDSEDSATDSEDGGRFARDTTSVEESVAFKQDLIMNASSLVNASSANASATVANIVHQINATVNATIIKANATGSALHNATGSALHNATSLLESIATSLKDRLKSL